jgi:hypothetical protein
VLGEVGLIWEAHRTLSGTAVFGGVMIIFLGGGSVIPGQFEVLLGVRFFYYTATVLTVL